ncbi:MAG TPA: glycosyltransferase family A protein [Solirubrobacteraceae bacterium]|jgi:GT2 family glycosyltransferase|nr:glycosyltransferase family A protein [Solirubrobacteraceae bacterium]
MASHSSAPCASIVIPTRMRPDYLRVALSSIAPQAAAAGAELIVVDDAGPSRTVGELAERFGARYEPHPRPFGLNVARNTGVERSSGELLVFVDDDVQVHEGWLAALLLAAREHPEVEVFTGPVIPCLEGSPPHSCGREGAPITTLDLGPKDTPARFAWGANMAIRRRALERIGPFDVSLEHGGDEQEWQERLRAEPGNAKDVLYVAGAALVHRRNAADARLRPLCRAAFARGKAARRFDAWRGEAPPLTSELATLAGCLGHVVRRRCPAALTMVAHSSGRLREAARKQDAPPARPGTSEDFLSGESGTVGGLDGVRRAALDLGADALDVASGRRLRLALAARRSPPRRRVLVLGVERPEHRKLVEGIRAELGRSRHELELSLAEPGDHGKFENINLLLDAHPLHDRDWLLVVDDDIVLPHGFLDRFLFLAERFQLDLAQPAHRLTSHAAWQVTRRRMRSVARNTGFVEIGPVTAFARSTFSTLLPFPDLRMGWGLDAHWAALARAQGWRCGVIDAVPIAHRAAPAASVYSREQALAEARAFLEHRPYLSAAEAQRTLATHRRW